MSDDEERVSEEEVRAALRAVRSADGPSLSDVLLLVNASLEREAPLVPQPVTDAVCAKFATDRDFANGGADQFAWNHGAEVTQRVAAAFRAVGAIENGDLLARLADELEAYQKEVGEEGDVVRLFLGSRKRVGGPFFRIPEPDEELAEALLEYVVEHAAELPDPDGKLPGFGDP